MSFQLALPLAEPVIYKVYEVPEMVHCNIHDDYDPQAFYNEDEIIEMMDKQGFIDCPYCLAEIVGISW